MLKIKVCGMTDPLNAGMISELQVDYLGFIFYPGSKRYVGSEPDDSLFRDLPGRIFKTGVFVNEDPEVVVDYMRRYDLDIVQLHGDETAEYCRSLSLKGIKIIKAFKVNEAIDFRKCNDFTEYCDFFLFDKESDTGGGSGEKFDWALLENYRSGKPFFLSGGIGPEDAGSILRHQHKDMIAIDINSRFESRPGFKDVAAIEKFIREING